MSEKFQFDVITPEKIVFSDKVEAVILPGSEGFFTVLAGHMELVSRIVPGEVRVRLQGGNVVKYVTFGGFAEVTPIRTSLMTETAMLSAKVDKADIERRIADARNLLQDVRTEESRSRIEEFIYHMSTIKGVDTSG